MQNKSKGDNQIFLCKTKLTHSMQKVTVEWKGHERVRKLSEPSFNQACDGVDGVVF